jgi:hypothetical protein
VAAAKTRLATAPAPARSAARSPKGDRVRRANACPVDGVARSIGAARRPAGRETIEAAGERSCRVCERSCVFAFPARRARTRKGRGERRLARIGGTGRGAVVCPWESGLSLTAGRDKSHRTPSVGEFRSGWRGLRRCRPQPRLAFMKDERGCRGDAASHGTRTGRTLRAAGKSGNRRPGSAIRKENRRGRSRMSLTRP